MAKKRVLKLYRGFGHTHNMVLFGHVLGNQLKNPEYKNRTALGNLFRLINLFIVQPLGNVAVETTWQEQIITTVSEDDGFFWLEWQAEKESNAGTVFTDVVLTGDKQNGSKSAEIIIPHLTQYAFISDIDDTVMISHSSKGVKRLRELLFRSPAQRDIFKGVAMHYQLLAISNTCPEEPNPFFYVSSSEWNLYDYLDSFFHLNGLPHGIFLLSQLKKWYQLLKTGKTKHEGKLLRIARLFVIFPKQHFVLLGDNSQSDPAIYETLTQKYSHRIAAVYIRNAVPSKAAAASGFLKKIEAKKIPVLQFTHSEEAIAHSRMIGLITV